MHSILSDTEKRKVYDRTGNIEDTEGLTESGKEWYSYWRNLFPEVTKVYIFLKQKERKKIKIYFKLYFNYIIGGYRKF